MYASARTSATPVLLLTLALAACGGDDTVGLPDGFDPTAIEAAVDAALTPLQATLEPTISLQSAFSDLETLGVSYDPADTDDTAVWSDLVPLSTRIAGDAQFPAELQGKTFVYQVNTESWGSDSTRTSAPADGIRIIWYSRNADGSLVHPLREQGHIDLTDQDTGGVRSAIGIEMVAVTDSSNVVLADFIESVEVAVGADSTETFTGQGYYSDGTDSVAFTVTSETVADTATGDQDFTFNATLDAPGSVYSMGIAGSQAGGSGIVDQTLTSQVTVDNTLTELTLDLLEDESEQQNGSGTLSYQGDPVIEVTVEGNNFSYTDTNGNSLASGDALAVDSLVRTLFLTGLRLLFNLPLLFL